MAFDKVIDSAVLDAGMTATANAIRAKTGGADPIVWDASNGFKTAVEGIEAGGVEVFYTPSGACYVEHMNILEMSASTSTGILNSLYANAKNLKSVTMRGGNISGNLVNTFKACTSLVTAIIANVTSYSHYFFEGCTALETIQLGSVGFPVTKIGSSYFLSRAKQDPMLTIYVDAETLADIPMAVTEHSPFGANNATIIYRNSTTGEVITE